MAVSTWVLLEVLLMVLFCREEVLYRLHLHCKLCPGDLTSPDNKHPCSFVIAVLSRKISD